MSTEVVVAIVGAAGVVIAAGFGFLGVWVSNIRKAVGEPNGRGDIAAMLGKLLDGQAAQDTRLASLEFRMGSVEGRVDVVERRAS